MNRTLKRFAPLVAVAGLLFATGCHTQRYGNDFHSNAPPTGSGTTESGTPTQGVILEDMNVNCDNPGTPGTVETCADQGIYNDGIDHIINDVSGNCISITGGSWGTVGAGHASPPSSATVNCFIDGVLDDPSDAYDLYSQVCLDSYDSVSGNVDNDCQNPDNSGTYMVLNANTAFYQNMTAGTFASPSYARAERMVELARDWAGMTVNENGSTRLVACVIWTGTGLPSAHWFCP